MVSNSVLMSVYGQVSPEELNQCLRSLKTQTRQPDQTVIVMDGPLPEPLHQLLKAYQAYQEHAVELVPIAKNQGLIHALNTGLKHCRGEWVIRMDADDIALPTRFEVQLAMLESQPDIDVLGCSMLEFDIDPTRPSRLKPALQTHAEIAAGLPFRNPINHPTACIRKARLDSVGGYPGLALLEDYYLWSKLLIGGARFCNITEPLYLFRFDDKTLTRRGGKRNFRNEIWLRRWMYDNGLMSYPRFCLFVCIQSILRFAPLAIRRFLWEKSRQPYRGEVQLPDEF